MRDSAPTVSELPPPPPGRRGWPWTVDGLVVPEDRAAGGEWPRISVVTPSFNQGEFIEETIRSVLLQGYPELEYIVMDGASTDATLDVLRKYERWLTFRSERDSGQANAINAGFALATGEVLAWLNSDDVYEPGALRAAAEAFHGNPEADVVSGRCRLWFGRPNDLMIGPSPLRSYEDFLRVGSNWMRAKQILQPESFFRARAYRAVGGLDESLYYAFDADFWIRLARDGHRFASFDTHVANLRVHPGQKTFDIHRGYGELCTHAWRHLRADWEILGDRAPLIADDLFDAMTRISSHYREQFEKLQRSTSFRLGRRITRLRFW